MHDKGGGMAAAAAFALALMLTCAVGDRIKVGGKDGWKPNVNYTHWAARHPFYVGDWLYFVFDKNYYNVLEVTKSNYERCNDEEFVKNITRGGRDVYNLTQAKAYYFLSSGGYCYEGMKLSIHVHRSPTEAPPPNTKSAKNGADPESKPDRVAFFFFLLMLSTFVFKLS